MEISVKEGQTFLDVLIRHTGTIETLFDVIDANEFDTLLPEPEAQQKIIIPDSAKAIQQIVNYFVAKKIEFATKTNEIQQYSGIEFWAIEMDFVVS